MRGIPCILMRGGSSRGTYYRAADLPSDRETLGKVLMAAMGAGSLLQTDGVGGGQPTTSKVAMLSRSDDGWAEIDYFFAQVHATKAEIDFAPSCGNILAGVGPAALEMGLVQASGDTTNIRIRNTNTGTLTEAVVATPGRLISYAGDARIDGMPGSSAPVILNFKNCVGSKTGSLFPTGRVIDVIGGIPVSCVDAAVPMVIARAVDVGLRGTESCEEINADRALFEKLEPIRIKAGVMMGLGDVSGSVVPKAGLLAESCGDGAITARYFTPWQCHPSFAVTGSICVGACLLAPGTVATGLARLPGGNPVSLAIEHPCGTIAVVFDYTATDGQLVLHNAGLLRTARKLFAGSVYIPAGIWG